MTNTPEIPVAQQSGVPADDDMDLTEHAKQVLDAIGAERMRQITREGFSIDHDDAHRNGELALAASCYALNVGLARKHAPGDIDPETLDAISSMAPVISVWPFDDSWWKPKSARHDLIVAAAMIVAEIERLDREEAKRRSIGGNDGR